MKRSLYIISFFHDNSMRQRLHLTDNNNRSNCNINKEANMYAEH